MKRTDFTWLAGLAISGIIIWCRGVANTALDPLDVFPLLFAFPLLWKLGAPWKFTGEDSRVPPLCLCVALLLGATGEVTGVSVLTVLGWTVALGSWLFFRSAPSRRSLMIRLMVLPLLGFPWLVGWAGGLGWHFRLSAAWVVEKCFAATGFALVRDGTLLSVQGEPISVEAACAGLGSLQAMLLAGAAAAAIEMGRSRNFWFCLPILFAAAWLANTLRVLIISAVALSTGRDFASGAFHGLAGWAVLMAVFAGCLALFKCMHAGAAGRGKVVIHRYGVS